MLPFNLPTPLGASEAPFWTGHGFFVNGHLHPVLEYSNNLNGWSDELTILHENTAGDSHPIDRASRMDALNQVKTFLNIPAPVILEIGCSSGFLLKMMKSALPTALIMGADVVEGPLFKLAEELPTVPLFRFDLLRCPLPSESVDGVILLNVLEHIEDDVSALYQIHRILKPKGYVILEVPACAKLYDAYDSALKHYRRYGIKELMGKVERGGFYIERKSHLGFFSFPAFTIIKLFNQLKYQNPESFTSVVNDKATKTSTNRLFDLSLRLERILSQWIHYPFGIRCLLVARKI